MTIDEDIALAPLTTMKVGGRARFFCGCGSAEEIRQGLGWAADRDVPVHVLGGGSNTIFSDDGFDGLVLHIQLNGVQRERRGDSELVTAGAGEDWDALVASCVDADLTGIECLSGIPGSVGASPMQNVGAYGQEVSQTLVRVRALERATLREVEFSTQECGFAYRQSRFKREDRDRFIITEVAFQLRRSVRPELRYAELRRYLKERAIEVATLSPGREASSAVREAVIGLRRAKSMVLNSSDPNSRSVGSFFLNPVLGEAAFEQLQGRCRDRGGGDGPIPSFAEEGGTKVPAAWLVERAGFERGFRLDSASISANHTLALVSASGTTARDIVELGRRIQETVEEQFGVRLEREPVVVDAGSGS